MRKTAIQVLIATICVCLLSRLATEFMRVPAPVPRVAPDERVFGRFKIKLTPPSGYCTLDPTHPAEATALQTIQKRVAANMELALAFARCAEPGLNGHENSANLDHYGILLVQAANGQPVTEPGVSRADYLDSVLRATGEQDRVKGKVKQVQGDIVTERVDPNAYSLQIRDDNAVYTGGFIYNARRTGEVSTIFMSAITMIDSIPIISSICESYIIAPPYESMYSQQKAYMEKLVSENRYIEEIVEDMPGNGNYYFARPLTVGDLILTASVFGLLGIILVPRLARRPAAIGDSTRPPQA